MKKLVLLFILIGIALVGFASAADTNATPAPQMIGGDKGAYLVNANVDGANVTFDNDYKGVIANGSLNVEVYTTGTPYRVLTVEKTGYQVYKVNITQYPGKGETVVMNVTMTKLVPVTTVATNAAANTTAATTVSANETTPAVSATTVQTTTVASPAPTKSGSFPIIIFAAFGLIGILAIASRR